MMFIPVLPLADLWEGEMQPVSVQGHKILLLHLQGQVLAYEDRCPHKGVPLSQGWLQGQELFCRAHHWQFDACTGKGLNPKSCKLRSLPVQLKGQEIAIDISPLAPTIREGGQVKREEK